MHCTLRAAIQEAENINTIACCPGGFTINFTADVTTVALSIAPSGANDITSGDLNITGTISIIGTEGAQVAIDANQIDRVINVPPGGNTLTLQDLVIMNGNTAQNGGGISVANSTLTLTRVGVNGNTAQDGGGIWIDGASSFTSSQLEGNSAHGAGGGIYFLAGNPPVTVFNDLTVSGNAAVAQGGGIYTGAPLTITGGDFSDNQALGSLGVDGIGGSIYASANLTITNATLNNNSAAGSAGGALLCASTTCTLTDVMLQGNTVTNDFTNSANILGGGGIYAYLSTLNLTGSDVNGNNVAGDATLNGGGIACGFGGPGASIATSTISNNTTTGSGGGIYCDANLQVEASDIFENTAAGDGAGIYAAQAVSYSTEIDGSAIYGNTAQGDGGGVYFSRKTGTGTLTLINTFLTYNTATLDGAGLYAESSGPNDVINFCTIAANIGSGVFVENSGAVQLSMSIVANNTTNCATAIGDGGGSVGTITSADYNLDSGISCAFAATHDLSNADPLLGGMGQNGGHGLSMGLGDGSPAIDAAGSTAFPQFDERLFLRPGGSLRDIGAFEAQDVDVGISGVSLTPDTINTGDNSTLAFTVTSSASSTSTTGVLVILTLPTGVSISGLGACVQVPTTTTAYCIPPGALDPNTSIPFSVVLSGDAAGVYPLSLSVQAADHDTALADNTATTQLTVNAPIVAGSSGGSAGGTSAGSSGSSDGSSIGSSSGGTSDGSSTSGTSAGTTAGAGASSGGNPVGTPTGAKTTKSGCACTQSTPTLSEFALVAFVGVLLRRRRRG